MPGTTTRDLCLIRALLATFRLPATRAQEFSRATRARLPLEAIWSRARAAIHETRRHFLAVRAAHRIGGRACVASPASCPALSYSARRRCLRLTRNRCAMRRAQETEDIACLRQESGRWRAAAGELASEGIAPTAVVYSSIVCILTTAPLQLYLLNMTLCGNSPRLGAPPSALHSTSPAYDKRVDDGVQLPACTGARRASACPACAPARREALSRPSRHPRAPPETTARRG